MKVNIDFFNYILDQIKKKHSKYTFIIYTEKKEMKFYIVFSRIYRNLHDNAENVILISK